MGCVTMGYQIGLCKSFQQLTLVFPHFLSHGQMTVVRLLVCVQQVNDPRGLTTWTHHDGIHGQPWLLFIN